MEIVKLPVIKILRGEGNLYMSYRIHIKKVTHGNIACNPSTGEEKRSTPMRDPVTRYKVDGS